MYIITTICVARHDSIFCTGIRGNAGIFRVRVACNAGIFGVCVFSDAAVFRVDSEFYGVVHSTHCPLLHGSHSGVNSIVCLGDSEKQQSNTEHARTSTASELRDVAYSIWHAMSFVHKKRTR